MQNKIMINTSKGKLFWPNDNFDIFDTVLRKSWSFCQCTQWKIDLGREILKKKMITIMELIKNNVINS